MRDSNPRHPACKAEGQDSEVAAQQELASAEIPACTTACTDSQNPAHGAPLEALADALRNLSAQERAALAQLLGDA